MTQRPVSNKPFDALPREELEGYAKDFGIGDTSSMSDTELRKRLTDVDPNTGVAPEGSGPVEHRGDPGRGPSNGR
jgi:hypothetical protein